MERPINLRNPFFVISSMLAALVFWQGITNDEIHHDSPIQQVGAESAKKLVDSGALVIDVRGPGQARYQRIPGAILVTVAELNAAIPAQLAAAGDRPILVYCGDGMTAGPEGTYILNQAGYPAVHLKGGIHSWQNAGMPVEKGQAS